MSILLAAAAAATMTSPSVTTIGDFTYYEQTDPISDNLLVGVHAENDTANLTIGCDHGRAKTIYVVLETQRFLTSSVANPSGASGNTVADLSALLGGVVGDTFQYRVDRDESHNARSEYTGIQTAFIEGRDARALVERFADGQSAFIRVSGTNGPINTRFDITGIRPLLKRVAERCGDRRLEQRLSQAN